MQKRSCFFCNATGHLTMRADVVHPSCRACFAVIPWKVSKEKFCRAMWATRAASLSPAVVAKLFRDYQVSKDSLEVFVNKNRLGMVSVFNHEQIRWVG